MPLRNWIATPGQANQSLATFVANALLELFVGMPVRIESHLYELARQYKKLNENIATDLDSAVETEALVAKTHFLSRFF